MIPLIVITGPTAVGKSSVALTLAEKIGGEIISADSLQVYRYFDIGSDKPPEEVLKRVPHHLIDIMAPDEDFSAGDFNERAYQAARDIDKRGKPVIICGGTGLYIKTLLENLPCGIPKDENLRRRLDREFSGSDPSLAYLRLKDIDPNSAQKIHPKDNYRTMRALEVYYSTGRPLSELHRVNSGNKRFKYHHIILNKDRQKLYERIEKRVDSMIRQGLPDETKGILEMGYKDSVKPFKTIGYSQMVRYVRGETSLDTAVGDIKLKTRRFAKRQLIWLRAVEKGEWVNIDPEMSSYQIVENIMNRLKN